MRKTSRAASGSSSAGGFASGWAAAAAGLRGFLQGVTPEALRETQDRVEDCLAHTATEVNEYGFDPFGFHRERAKPFFTACTLLYEKYFRTEAHGIERVPAGRVLLVANHAGQIPTDGLMLAAALLTVAKPPRVVRGMSEYWLGALPWFNDVARAMGTAVGTPETCAEMLRRGECVLVFPEGVRGLSKTYAHRYELQPFGAGFMRLALETQTPIVPVGVIGTEEQQIGIANLTKLGQRFGMPSLPITLGFPWLGPFGLLPLPVKVHLYFGKPLYFEGRADDEPGVHAKVDTVREALAALLQQGLAARQGIFA